jgi:hypothetical protein
MAVTVNSGFTLHALNWLLTVERIRRVSCEVRTKALYTFIIISSSNISIKVSSFNPYRSSMRYVDLYIRMRRSSVFKEVTYCHVNECDERRGLDW